MFSFGGTPASNPSVLIFNTSWMPFSVFHWMVCIAHLKVYPEAAIPGFKQALLSPLWKWILFGPLSKKWMAYRQKTTRAKPGLSYGNIVLLYPDPVSDAGKRTVL